MISTPAERPISEISLLTKECRENLTWTEVRQYVGKGGCCVLNLRWERDKLAEQEYESPFIWLCEQHKIDPDTLPEGTLTELPINQQKLLRDLGHARSDAKRVYEVADRAWKKQWNVIESGKFPESETIDPYENINMALNLIDESALLPPVYISHGIPLSSYDYKEMSTDQERDILATGLYGHLIAK